jgi:predicted secreted Zn-dependent protease
VLVKFQHEQGERLASSVRVVARALEHLLEIVLFHKRCLRRRARRFFLEQSMARLFEQSDEAFDEVHRGLWLFRFL